MSKIWYTKGWLIYQFVYGRIPRIKILLIVKLFLDIPSVNLGQSYLKCSVCCIVILDKSLSHRADVYHGMEVPVPLLI